MAQSELERKKYRSFRLARMGQVVELMSQGLGPSEVSRQLNLGMSAIYSDLDLYRRIYDFFDRTQQRVPHLMAKSNRALKAAWVKLSPLLADPSANPRTIASILSVINSIVATQARILGVDKSTMISGVGEHSVTALIVKVETPEGSRTIDLGPPQAAGPTLELPTTLLDDGHASA